MATLIQVRRDTLANWNSNNPVLANGEIGFVTDNNRIKIGNGSSTFTSLSYIEADAYLDSVILGTDTTGAYVTTVTPGSGISVSGAGTESASVIIDNTGVLSLTGTANEVEVSASAGAVTLSLPSTINADTTGNAATATALQTSRNISLGGDLSGSASFNGTSDVTITATVINNSVALGTDTTGDYVQSVSASGSGLSISGSGESATVTIQNTGVTALTGTTNEVDVSASAGAVTISLPSTINADTTGNSATATALQNSRNILLGGDLSGSASFNGTSDITITASVVADSVALGTDTTGDYVQSVSASGAGLSISGTGEGAAVTVQNTGVISLTGTVNQVSVSASNGGVTVSLPSSVTFPGVVTLNANPGQPLEAATKQYVDAIAEGLHIHASVQAATSASVNLLSPTASVDGVALTNGMRVLVKNQPTQADNGIYTYNSASNILVRADDFNSSAEIQGGDFVFVTGGSLYENTGWVQTEIVTTLDSDPIMFQQFSGAGTYTAGQGLYLDGTQFSNTGVLSLTGTSDEITVSASAGDVTISLPATINANTTGNAATATSLENARAISLGGDLSGSASFNGTSNITITADIVANSVALGTDTTGDYVQSVSASGAGISISGTGEGAVVSVQNTGVTSLSGTNDQIDVSASTGSITVSLPNTAVTPASYGSASAVPTLTVDAKGRITAASNTNIAIAQSAVTNLTSDLALKASISYVDAKSYTLDSLSDVSASAPANNDLLVYESGLTTTTWTLQTSNFDPYSNIWNASYGNDLWVAVGDSGQLRTSTDTVSWVTQVSNFENAGNARIKSVAYNDGLWIAGGYTNELRTSTNAITWITQNPKVGNRAILEITYGNGIWVGLASSWSITSTDTISWTTASLTTDYSALAYGQGIWAVAGGYGTLRTSTNGINWTTSTSNFGDTGIVGISYGNGLWVAAGNSGQMRTSTNAVTWITRNSNFGTTRIQDIVYGAGVWIAVGYNGQVRSSTDTVTWTTQTSGFGISTIYSVSYGNSKWVATGEYGKISTLPFTQQWKSISSINQSSITNLVSDLALKAPLASPTFTGTVTVPTPSNSTDAATKGYVDTSVINSQSASYNLVLADAGEIIEMNVATANNLTVPPNASAAFAIGTLITVVQYGAGQTTIVAGSGVTLRSSGSKLKLTSQYSAATLYKRGTDEWVVMGDLSA